MQGPSGHRGWIGATAALTLCLALTWGLLRFGAAETTVLYRLFLWLLVPALLALLIPNQVEKVDWRVMAVLLVGLFLLGQVVIQPTLEASGYLRLAVGWVALWLTLSLTLGRSRQARFLVGMLVLLGVFEACYGLAQAVGGFDYIGDYFRGRGRIATGTLINRNHYAALLNLLLPLAVGLLLADQALKRSQRASRSESLAKTWVVLLGCSVMGVAVLMSQSRGGTVSLLLTLLFMALLLGMSRRRVTRRGLHGVTAVVLLFLVLGMGAAFGLEALLERFGRLDEGLSRLEVYRDTLSLIGDEWILGVGPGMFQWRFPLYQTTQPGSLYDHAHNDYLETASEWGVLLALLIWGLVLWRFYRASMLALSAEDPWRRGLGLGCAGALFSILSHSLVDFSLQIPAILMVFACVLGLSWSLEFPSARRTSAGVGEGLAPSLVLHVLLAVALLAAGWQTLQRSRAAESARAENGLPGLERAVRIDPDSPEPHFLFAMANRDMPGTGDLDMAAAGFESAVRLNPYSRRYWLEYARTQELLGEVEQAESGLRVVVALSPNDGENHWRLANLLLRQGEQDEAVDEIATAVELEPRLAEPGVALLLKSGVGAGKVESLLPSDRSAQTRLFRSLLTLSRQPASGPAVSEGSETVIATLWSRLLGDEPPLTVAEGRPYVDHLFRADRLAEARDAWVRLSGANGISDPQYESGTNRVWNGNFELELSGRPLGWQVGQSDAFEATRDSQGGEDESAALVVDFLGTENLNFSHLSQQLILEPGVSYRLRSVLRAEALTTDQGILVEVISRNPSGLLVATQPIVGTTGWIVSDLPFTTPEGSGQATIRLRRLPSQQIDNRIRGKVWLDSIGVEQVTP